MWIVAEPRLTGALEDQSAARAVVDSKRKRALDVVVSVAGLVLLSPLLLATSLVLVLGSGWPPLYAQRRVGLDGRTFRMWKFRTMVRNAHSAREELLARNEGLFPAFKMRCDPRTTRIGSVLRRSSLDELPQLWNVLKGEMSLVGPRPPLPEEVRYYDDFALRRLGARPGLTCTWQIESRHGGHNLRFDDWVRKDLAYIEHWSMWLDFILLLRTVRVVAGLTGH